MEVTEAVLNEIYRTWSHAKYFQFSFVVLSASFSPVGGRVGGDGGGGGGWGGGGMSLCIPRFRGDKISTADSVSVGTFPAVIGVSIFMAFGLWLSPYMLCSTNDA